MKNILMTMEKIELKKKEKIKELNKINDELNKKNKK